MMWCLTPQMVTLFDQYLPISFLKKFFSPIILSKMSRSMLKGATYSGRCTILILITRPRAILTRILFVFYQNLLYKYYILQVQGSSGPQFLAGGSSGFLTSSFAPCRRFGRVTYGAVIRLCQCLDSVLAIGQCVGLWIVCQPCFSVAQQEEDWCILGIRICTILILIACTRAILSRTKFVFQIDIYVLEQSNLQNTDPYHHWPVQF